MLDTSATAADQTDEGALPEVLDRIRIAEDRQPAVPRFRMLAYAAATGLVYALLSQFVNLISVADGAATFWPAAGLTLGVLLARPRREWPLHLSAVFIAEALMDVKMGHGWALSTQWAAVNTLEPFIGAVLLTRGGRRAPDIAQHRDLVRFIGFGVVAGPAVGALAGTVGGVLLAGDPWWPRLPQWFVGDAVGALVVAPAVMVVVSGALRWPSRKELVAGVVLVAGTLLAVGPWEFSGEAGLPFLVVPALIAFVALAGPAGAAVGVLALAFTVFAVTLRGHGPFAHADAFQGLVIAQMFLVMSALSALTMAAVLRELVSRHELERQLRALALTDTLTGLSNRRQLFQRIEHASRRLSRTPGRLALLFIDLDHFKELNDALGHASGDAVLVEVAQRLRTVARDHDTVARIGGDEFLVLVEDFDGSMEAEALAERIIRAISGPIPCPDGVAQIGASIGYALVHEPIDGPNAVDAFVATADRAMYEAKRQGGGRAFAATADRGRESDDGSAEPFQQSPHARARAGESSGGAADRLFEMSSDLLGTAFDGYLTRLNPAWERTLGWAREDLMSEPFVSFVHPDDVEATIAAAAALAKPGRQQVIDFENRFRTSAGKYQWLQWSSVSNGGTIYFVGKDVTARKAAEAERGEDLLRVRRSEALHRTLSANLPDSTVFLLDHDLRILLAKGEAVRRLPWFSEDLFIGRLVGELYTSIPAYVLDLAIENYTAVLQGERRSFEFSNDGTMFVVNAVPVLSDDGSVDAALVVALDVTEQRLLTAGLRRSEERLLKAEGLVGGGSWELALNKQAMTWSSGLGLIHGDVPVDGREPVLAYAERVLPADRAHFHRELARCEEAGRAAFEYRIMRPDGAVRTLTVEAELADRSDGDGRFLRGAVLDVTDERAAFDAAPIGMLVAEPEHTRILRANDALCSLLGRSREELLGQRVSDLTHPDDRASAAEKRQALTDGTANTYEAEKRYLRPDGSVVWVSVYVTALHNTDGSVRAFSSQAIDITERKTRAAALERARLESLRKLAIASEYRNNETHEHTERVGSISVEIGRVLGMTEAHLDLLCHAAPLHDIGKIGIADAILLKPGRLTDQERQVMQRHTLIGVDILANSDSPVLNMAEEIALTHHERWDGQGYPNRLTAQTIPLVGRIVAIADVFDALTHERPYKEAWSVDRAVAHIRAESGLQFDPSAVAAFAVLDHAALLSLDRHEKPEAGLAGSGTAGLASMAEDDKGVTDRDRRVSLGVT